MQMGSRARDDRWGIHGRTKQAGNPVFSYRYGPDQATGRVSLLHDSQPPSPHDARRSLPAFPNSGFPRYHSPCRPILLQSRLREASKRNSLLVARLTIASGSGSATGNLRLFPPSQEQPLDFMQRKRLAEYRTLHLSAAFRPDTVKLLFRFHAFRSRRHAHSACKCCNSPHDAE
jgi:hypothetical protein